MNTGQVL